MAAVLLATVLLFRAHADTNGWNTDFPPSPVPFTLNSYDVIQAVEMIKRERYLQYWDYESSPVTIVVWEAYSYHAGYDGGAFEEHRNRYDIMLNGSPLDWDHLYIEYGTEMVNLRLLFTYRNQRPVPDIPYILKFDGYSE